MPGRLYLAQGGALTKDVGKAREVTAQNLPKAMKEV